jgi:hypothetical protein
MQRLIFNVFEELLVYILYGIFPTKLTNLTLDTKIIMSNACRRCRSDKPLTIQRHERDDIHSLQLITYCNCGLEWEEIWSSYSRCIWTSQEKIINGDTSKERFLDVIG